MDKSLDAINSLVTNPDTESLDEMNDHVKNVIKSL